MKDRRQRTRPLKKPRQARSQQTVNAIVEASARILEEQGTEGFNTNAVAQLAGVSIGTLYQYFSDKTALLSALIARETSTFVEGIEAISKTSSGIEALVQIIKEAVKHQLLRPRLATLLDFEEALLPFDLETRRVRERFLALLIEILARPDLVHQQNISMAAADVSAIIRGMVDAAGERGEDDEESLVNRVSRAVFGYLSYSTFP